MLTWAMVEKPEGVGGDWEERYPDLNLSGAVLLCLDGLAITNTMFEHKVIHTRAQYKNTLDQSSMINFVVISLDGCMSWTLG